MNKKYIKLIGMWVGIITGTLAAVSSIIYIFKELRELIVLTIVLLLLSLICFFVLWYKEKNAKETSENKNKRLKKVLREKEDRIIKLEKEMCKECKKIYSYSYPGDERISFDENPNKDECFSLIEEVSDDYEEISVHHLEKQWIFISFWGEEEKDHLIDLIGKSIYLHISKWEESKRDPLIYYKILCSNRKIHLDLSQLI